MSVDRSPSDGAIPVVPGYSLGGCFRRDVRHRFFGATSAHHGPVVVRLHASPVPTERELAADTARGSDGRAPHRSRRRVAHLDLVPSGRDLALVTGVVDGARPLRSFIGSDVTLVEACTLGASVASALSGVHRAGLVYGALSPDSVLVDLGGAAYLADLERASDVEAETSPLFGRTPVGTALTYLSPEQTGRVESCGRRPQRPVLPRPRAVRAGVRIAALH